ncbi:response regulator transcription factor [Paradevosia shaoguanensis]|uniref:Response regulator transcription factor n=1 Tax=Paradevosia shaoguanensis TaxID=1335043 RepID=A0AA41QNK4_9HYPH|nr:response regulator transcription factor [Paradevosia shaoguanensis]KFL27495.1 PhoB family transcriptional regulator [Devosia sp. 17-2-E-8]QMV01387.1 response regulator [Devosia sp. D6-9]CDP51855.1 two-component response regulator [Devosia sp. DBB001]MCF1743280.1 response regulator transcription factor [Paradevosia shaoguanensis]MCI0127763.1 response regulator transcription factor [Paradevosia shaoguanensis]
MKILIVEDDRRIASFLERGLVAEGYQVSIEQDGRDGLERARTDSFDLIILDRMLPYVDGMEVCRILREERRPVLILMLTAKDSLQDKVEGLKGGADDYLTKPFAFDELLARIYALRRRRTDIDHEGVLRIGPLVLDPQSRRVAKDEKPISLTVREFELLRYLMVNAGKVVSRQRLLNSVWEYGYDPGTKIVDVYVRYVRAKIDEPGLPSLIETVRGVGYMIGGEASA